MVDFQAWKKSAIGRAIDVDKAFGDQCVDVLMDYAQYCFKGKKWPQLIGYGNAKDMYNTASPSYFQKIANKRSDPNQLPKQGDVAVFGATKTNPYGHVGVVDSATSKGINLIQQDGFNPKGKCFEKFRPWTASTCIGWLRPKVSFVSKVAQKVAPKPSTKVTTYVIHKGDTVTAICVRFRISIAKFKSLNPSIKNINKVYVGQKVTVK